MDDPQRLKIHLMCQGTTPTDAALAALPQGRFGQISVRDYPTTSGMILRLSETIYVNLPLRLNSNQAIPLNHDGTEFFLALGSGRLPVQLLPPPDYALNNRRLTSGKPLRNVVNTHADRIRLTPLYGCGFSCQYCNYPGMVYRRNTLEELVDGVSIALKDRIHGPPHILVSGGSPRMEEPEFRYLNEVYQALPGSHPNLAWDLMIAPRPLHPGPPSRRKYTNFISFLKESGFSALSINLELYGEDVRQRYIPEKEKIGLQGYLEFLEIAVEMFGPGKVRSVILVGLEPLENTLKGVEALAQRGVLPELSPFNADPGAFLARTPEPKAEELYTLWQMAIEIMARHGMDGRPFCQACSHNIL